MENLLKDHLWVVILVLLIVLPIKAAALWRSARRGHVSWFLALIILNTLGILDLLYIFVFSNWGNKKKKDDDDQDQNVTPPTRQVRQPNFASRSRSN